LPIAVTLLQQNTTSKLKCFKKLYVSASATEDLYSRMSDAILASLPKPKGSNSEILKIQSDLRNWRTGALENLAFEKIEQIFDVVAKCSSVFTRSFDGAVWHVGHSFLEDKGKYEISSGTLKTPAEMVDFYLDNFKKYPFLKYIITPFLPAHADQQETLLQKIRELSLEVKICSSLDNVGQPATVVSPPPTPAIEDNEPADRPQTSEKQIVNKCALLDVTSSAQVHCRQALRWYEESGKAHDLILTDGVTMLSKFLAI